MVRQGETEVLYSTYVTPALKIEAFRIESSTRIEASRIQLQDPLNETLVLIGFNYFDTARSMELS